MRSPSLMSMSIFEGVISAVMSTDAARAVAGQVKLSTGFHVEWSGQFEFLERAAAERRVIPATLLLIFVLLYLNFGRLTETLIVMLSVPFLSSAASGSCGGSATI